MVAVLVVEDAPSEQALLVKYLTEAGFLVMTASNGQEALQKLAQKLPDVVITDLVMPDMSGLELCRHIKKNESTKQLPVVACTSKGQELDRLWGLKQGIDVYLVKPYRSEELIQAVRSVL